MAGDITRSTFDPKKGYTSVRMQQGRLQLDADWNEQADIQNHLRRAYVTDMIGSGSGASKVDPITGKPSDTNFQLWLISTQPLPSRQGQDSGTAADSTAATDTAADSETNPNINTATEPNSATAIAPGASGSGTESPATQAPPITDLVLLPGHFYINGILCESTPGSPFTVKSVAAKDVSATTLQVVDSLTIDSQRLKKGDWLIRDTSPANNANPDNKNKPVYQEGWRIRDDIDDKTRILTVDGPPMGTNETLRRVITYTTQPDFPEAPPLDPGTYLAYLDVWERQLSAIDDPTLREVALNVPDTTTRTKTVWQVKLMSLESQTPAIDKWEKFQQRTQFRGKDPQGKDYSDLVPQLKACARLCPGTSTNGITANRLGNFLYRVEVHQGNDSDANPFEKRSLVTFKWSRTNGSVVSPIKKLEGDVIRIAKASQDVWADSQPGQWLELLTLAQELKGEPGVLVPLVRVSDTKIEFDSARIIGGAIPDNVTKVRRWDHSVDKAPQGAIPIQSEWIELESGIKVQFYPNRTYRTGDYWLIPSRTATNDIEWPSDRADEDVTRADNQGASVSQPLPQPPNGIEHQYALLAIVKVGDQNQITQVTDQRVLFPPLQRTLDTAGGTITGNLTINQNLEIKETTTTKDLKVTGQFAADTFRGKTIAISNLPLNNTAPNYGTLTAETIDGTPYLAFRTEANHHFAFLNGNVNIGIGSANAPSHTLSVNGIINGLDVLKNGQALAPQSALDEHVDDRLSNPHNVTAEQVDGSDHRIVQQINKGDGNDVRIDEDRIDTQIARLNQVTAEQVDSSDHAIVQRINQGDGNDIRIDEDRIDTQIARADSVVSLANGGNISGKLGIGVENFPSLDDAVRLYVKGDIHVVGDNSDGGKVFATDVSSGSFTQLSSATLKDEITELSRQEVAEALGKLNPVKFVFRNDAAHVPRAGFIAENVPDLLATPDHKSIKIMDLIAILTKAVQDNRKVINQLSKQVSQQTEEINQLKQALAQDSSQV